MAYNNTVHLTGNLGADPEFIDHEHNPFAVLSLATTDSYKNKGDQWQNKETIWHRVLVFSPKVIEQVKQYHKGDRIDVIGSLSYKTREVSDHGQSLKIHEAGIVARKIDAAPLPKKQPDPGMEPQ